MKNVDISMFQALWKDTKYVFPNKIGGGGLETTITISETHWITSHSVYHGQITPKHTEIDPVNLQRGFTPPPFFLFAIYVYISRTLQGELARGDPRTSPQIHFYLCSILR